MAIPLDLDGGDRKDVGSWAFLGKLIIIILVSVLEGRIGVFLGAEEVLLGEEMCEYNVVI